MDWIEAVESLKQGSGIAAEGKTLRRSVNPGEGKKALQMVSAWASEQGVVLGQRKVDGRGKAAGDDQYPLKVLTG